VPILILNRMHTESSSCSRKSFFAKLGGLLAAVWVVPSLLSGSTRNSPGPAELPVKLRPEQRAVARQEGSF